MKRRPLIVGGVLALGGCSTLFDTTSDGVTIQDLKGFNLHSEPHTAHVQITDKQETVYKSSFELGPSSASDAERTFYVRDGLPNGPGDYVVRLWRDDAAPKVHRLSKKRPGESVSLLFNISQNGHIELFIQTN
ncbi:hypothetical protein [Natronomonas sp. EA1]|uniref:hypothetical protein n=1 Tax=Natronomonas sp. EA1 TaxID=3421655 RepID=UPI003EBC7C46